MDEQARFESVLDTALHRGLGLSETALQLIQSLMPAGCTFGTMPHASVYRLHVFATTSYRGALTCLRWPETSLSTPILLRALLETWSHIEFIGNDQEGGDVRCRALRYERGVLRSWSDIARGHLAWLDMSEWEGQHEEYARGIDALWQEFGCGNAAARTNKHAQATLRTLARRDPHMRWVMPAWASASAIAHGLSSDIPFRSDGTGTSDLVWARPAGRLAWLGFLIATYDFATASAAAALGSNGTGQLELDLRAAALGLGGEVAAQRDRELGKE